MTVRRLQQERGWAFNLAVPIVKPTMLAASRRTWIDGEKVPATGGCVVVFNHISHLDPLMSAHLLYDHGRLPRYLAKSGLFRNRILSRFLHDAGQIPVERLTRNAASAFTAAAEAVRRGECVVVYPEGTLTRDPDLWPMVGKSGAARIALATGAPVIPVGQWGAHEVLPPYTTRPRLLPRKRVVMKVGDPVDLSDLSAPSGPHPTTQVVDQATARIMAALVEIVEELRDEKAPVERFDPRRAGIREIGNPRERRNDVGKETP